MRLLLTTRRTALETELTTGRARLDALDTERQQLATTCLRIEGALLLLKELLEVSPTPEDARDGHHPMELSGLSPS